MAVQVGLLSERAPASRLRADEIALAEVHELHVLDQVGVLLERRPADVARVGLVRRRAGGGRGRRRELGGRVRGMVSLVVIIRREVSMLLRIAVMVIQVFLMLLAVR